MPEDPSFAEFLKRIRAGDAQAATELVRRYETTVRAVVRARLTDVNLRRQFDSLDVCQSVLASFFFRVAAGQYDLRAPEDLIALLVRMAQNKLAHRRRFHRQKKRDLRRVQSSDSEDFDLANDSPSPLQAVMGRELLERAFTEMTQEERALAQRRTAGRSWEAIAKELGGTAEARRKQYSRTLERLATVLGVEEAEPPE